MGKVTIIAGKTKQERKVQRQQLGTLKANTVASRTRTRYDGAMKAFYLWARSLLLRIPNEAEGVDPLYADFIEHLWESGESLSLAIDGLSGLQDLRPRFRGHLALSWRLIKTWQRKEVPQRAPPFPEDILQSICGYFLSKKQHQISLAMEVAFYAILRTGELLNLKNKQIQVSTSCDCAILSLGATKTSQRSGVSDSVTLRVAPVCQRLLSWKQKSQPNASLVEMSEYQFRKSFDEALATLKLTSWGFRPYSLRRGGATMYWRKNPNMDSIRLMGRWASEKTARIYIQDGMSRLAEMQFSVAAPPLQKFYSLYARQGSSLRNSRERG